MLPEGIEGWVVTRYADVRAVLSDPRFVRDPVRVARLRSGAGLGPVSGGGGRVARGETLLHLDPPEHTRIRRGVSPLFSARRTEGHRSMIDASATTLVGRCAGSGRADLVCDLAVPLAVGVLCRVAGLPSGDHTRFGTWVRTVHRIEGGAEAGQRIVEAIAAIDRYLDERIADGSVTGVLAELAELVGRPRASSDPSPSEPGLTEDELVAFGRDLLVGGYESTAVLISGGLALLLAEPARYQRLRREPEALDATVEECLRQVAPFPQVQARYATQEMDLGGVRIGSGEAVIADIAAANRDPDRFPDPDRWSPAASAGHLSFGHGTHHCLGAGLARWEARAAMRAVITGLDDVRLACSPEDLVWEPGLSPTLRSLPVRFTPRPIRDGDGS
ncbi:cytochrome P450 [Pseudonocardia humida]|nr:cytochrome P450 [Pseudonocardia humida]